MEMRADRGVVAGAVNSASWGLIIQGVIAVIFGILAVLYPGATLAIMVTLFGLFALVDGIAAIVVAIGNRRWWAYLIAGIVGIGIGIAVLAYPGLTLVTFFYLIAAWAVVRGIFQIGAAFRNEDAHSSRWLVALAGVLSIIFGILLFAYPLPGILALAWLLGFYAMLYGFILIALGVEARGVVERFTSAMQH